MANKSYFKVDPKTPFRIEKYAKIIQDTQREHHKKWGQRMAAGYNKIVKDWSSDVRPYFRSITKYFKATNNVFVYVYIEGSEDAKMVFNMLDHGAKRGQVVKAPQGGAATEQEDINPMKKLPTAPPPRVYPRLGKIGFVHTDESRESQKAWDAYNAKLEAGQRASTKTAKKTQGPGRTRKGTRLGIQRYIARTKRDGSYTGAGRAASATPKKSTSRPDQAWRGHGQPKSIKLGRIYARRWSWQLRGLIQGKNMGMGLQIWGPNMSQERVTYQAWQEVFEKTRKV